MKQEKKVAMVVSDYFTRMVDVYYLTNQKAVTVAGVLVDEFISGFGVTIGLHTNQGRTFGYHQYMSLNMCRESGLKYNHNTGQVEQS
uniref:Integrase catalytic domain-containing protein n=1 Tax=Timema bartmani TaxID=61472 RepID=A0A7R9EVU8_9NEOP|nr:unnamed protein product [Timema bartmani]